MQPITVTVLAKNASETLPATLASLSRFPEVLLVDTGSTDKTMEIAKTYPNVRIVETPFLGFGKTHNLASEAARYDWILSIDSDEVVSEELAKEIDSLLLDPEAVYSLNRRNYFNGKNIRCCAGWHPDPVNRLFHRGMTRFTDAAVHETVIIGGFRLIPLQGPLLHTPYRSIEHFLGKMQLYTTLFADQNEGKSSSLGKALRHGLAAFFKSYIFKRGFLGGKEGFIISVYNAHTAYYKYLKLAFRGRPKEQ